MSNANSKGQGGDGIEKIVAAFGKVFFLFGRVCVYGKSAWPKSNLLFWLVSSSVAIFLAWIAFRTDYLPLIAQAVSPTFFSELIASTFIVVPRVFQFLGLYSLFWLLVLFVFGLPVFGRIKRTQRAIDRIGFKDGIGEKPKVLEVVNEDRHRQRIILSTGGVGVDKFRTRQSDLESALGKIVQRIEPTRNHSAVEIVLSSRRLPELVSYLDLVDGVKKPFSFVVGETMDGPIYCSINELPHLLVAGMTGSGKSVFLKNALLSILQSSKRVRLYLLDLKRGVEMKEFEDLPNVEIAKNEEDAVKMLRKVKNEMERRFAYLEENGLKEVDPFKHKMDQIVVVVDEASVLYGKERAGKSTKLLVDQAREITDSIAKVSRVTRISLILATQKISKETVDTKVQENMGAKICFRTSTLQNSMTVLNSPEAYKLPAVKGRAYWRHGLDLLEVQTPFMGDETKQEEIKQLVDKFNGVYGKDENEVNEIDREEMESEQALKRLIERSSQ